MKKNLISLILLLMYFSVSIAQTYTFTNCSATGAVGPTQALVNAAYTGANTLTGKVTSLAGIQKWIVPVTCTYRIIAKGANGGGTGTTSTTRGGYGASIQGDFTLTQGDVLRIAVGQQGTANNYSGSNWSASGGGGSFVVNDSTNSVLLIAGGGGGRGPNDNTAKNATVSSGNGNNGNPSNQSAGGTSGSGGGKSTNSYGAGGGGYSGDGTDATRAGGGEAFTNGAKGGVFICSTVITCPGGFGGGGGSDHRQCTGSNNGGAGGGGGGYSGGGGGGVGGGGGYINNGTNGTNVLLTSAGHGSVTIQLIGTAPTGASFSTGATTLCVGDSSTYTATATGGTTVKYSILTGGATIDSITGKVSSVTSSFTVRATISNCVGSITVDRAVTVQTQTAAPSITTPLCAGATLVSGTSAANASVILTVNGVAQTAVSADGAGAWSRSVAALTAGDSVTATAQVTGQCESVSSTAVVVLSTCSPTWLGTTSSDWGTPSNWSNGVVPNSCAIDITIPASTPNDPTISAASYTVGNVSIASGVNLTLTGNNLNVCGNWAGGSGTNAVTVGTGNVVFQGTAAQTITGRTNFESLTVNSSGGYTNSGIVTVSRIYRPQSGTLSNTGSITFLSSSASDIATIDLTTGNTGTITGNIIAERFVPVSGSNQHYVSSPVNNLPLSQLGASGAGGFVVPTASCDETILAAGSPYGTVFRYNEANGTSCSLAGWEVVGGGTAENARGYSAYLTGAGAPLSVTGAANMSATYTKGGNTNSNWTNTTLQGRTQNSGWTLVGNPYLSTINLADKTGAGFDNQAQVWQTSGPYAGTYQAVMMGGGSAFVAPFQGFMVHNNTPSTTIDFTVGRTECVNSTSTFYKTGSSNGTLSIKVAGNNYNDITKVVFDDQATNSFDPAVDANKLPVRLVQPSIATKVSNTLYSINNLESISTNPMVAMDFMAGTNGTFTFTVDDIATFDPTVMIYLEDKNASTAWQNLRTSNTYTFTGTTADAKDRFVLHFAPAAFVEAIDATCNTAGEINMEQEGTTVWTVNVKDANNTAVVSNQPLNVTSPLKVANLTAGNYTVEMLHTSGYTATKVIAVNGVTPMVASYAVSNVNPMTNQSVSFTSTVNQTANITWDFGDGSTSNQANPIHVYANAGNYTVLLTATSADGCTSTYSQSINVSRSTTGINAVNAKNEVAVYTVDNNKVTVAFKGYTNETAKISLYNVLGQELFTTNAHNADANFVHSIDQVEMQYVMVRVTVGGQTITKKVIVTNK